MGSINMKLKTLNESLSDVVYHSSTYADAKQIISSNTFKLSSLFANKKYESAINTKKYFYMSTTRSKFGRFHYPPNRAGFVLFKLNGNKLNNNFAASAYNYYNGLPDTAYDEMEDRILSNKPEIVNAASYIEEIDIFIHNEVEKTNTFATIYNDIYYIIRDALDKNIPIKLFFNNKNFTNNIPNYVNDKALSYIKKKHDTYGEPPKVVQSNILKNYAPALTMIQKLINGNNNFTKKEQMEYMELKNNSEGTSEKFIENLSRDMGAFYSSDAAREITKWARLHKLKDVPQLINYLRT